MYQAASPAEEVSICSGMRRDDVDVETCIYAAQPSAINATANANIHGFLICMSHLDAAAILIDGVSLSRPTLRSGDRSGFG